MLGQPAQERTLGWKAVQVLDGYELKDAGDGVNLRSAASASLTRQVALADPLYHRYNAGEIGHVCVGI